MLWGFAAFVLTAVSYGLAWLLRSKYTPITLSSDHVAKFPLYAGIGLLVFGGCCVFPVSCTNVQQERQEAVEEYKEKQERNARTNHSGQWVYGRLDPDTDFMLGNGIFEAPATIEARGDEFRFTIRWKTGTNISRTAAFSGSPIRHQTHAIYRGTWFTANTNKEGEWTLFRIDDRYYCGWISDKGGRNEEPFFLRQE
jgi:hypothetical protein